MKTFTLSEARSAVAAGGVLSANLTPVGSLFALEFETRNGAALLVTSVSKEVRHFANPLKAFEIIHGLGLEGGHFSLAQWRPHEKAPGRATRPDKSVALRTAHDAANLKRTLEARLQEADSPGTVWQDHNEVFTALEKNYAD